MASTNDGNNGWGLGGVLFVVFLVLKLCKVIDWSWWWVTAPLWGGVVLVVAFVMVAIPIDAYRDHRAAVKRAKARLERTRHRGM